MAEGGCVTTNNTKMAKLMRCKLNHGIKRFNKKNKNFLDPWYYHIDELGYNYRASELNSALGLSQIKKLKMSISEREKIAETYRSQLKGITSISFPKNSFNFKANAWHLFTILINFKKINFSKRTLINKLEKNGIGTQVHYIPLFMQPIYKNIDKKKFTGAIEYYEKNLSLPMYVGLKKKDIIYICKILKTYL